MSLTMSREKREAFLAADRIGIVSIEDPGRGPLTVPVWYHYEPGGTLRFATGGSSRKIRLMEASSRASFCVQTEEPPYAYVTVEGPVTVGPADYERDLREMAVRYLGPDIGEAYLAQTHPKGQVGDTVVVTLTPRRWGSADYGQA